jgi:hypothetical protein
MGVWNWIGLDWIGLDWIGLDWDVINSRCDDTIDKEMWFHSVRY